MVFELNKTYNFNTRAPAILSASFEAALVLGIFDYTTALRYISPETKSVNVYPYLPVGTTADPKKYTYILFKGQSGEQTVLAKEWIDESTIVLVTSKTITVTVLEASLEDATRIRDSLILLGLNKISISIS
jgi:hypothetical protein